MKIVRPLLYFFLLLAPALAELPQARVDLPARVAQLDEADDPVTGLGLADTLLGQGRFQEAEQLARRALAAEPQNQQAQVIVAKALIAQGDLEQALLFVNPLLESDPQDPDLHALKGMIDMLSDRIPGAVESLGRALELGRTSRTPDQLAAYANSMVLALHRGGKKAEALAACRDFLLSYPEDGDLYLSCSRLYREAGDNAKALEIATQGLAKCPEFYRLYASVALAQAGLGNKEASEKAYEELKSRDPQTAEMLRATLDRERPDQAEYNVRVEN